MHNSSDYETLVSPLLEPWGNKLVPCGTQSECHFVNDTLVAGLVYNSFCSRINGVESQPGSVGYCVCPPYQFRGGPICDTPTGLEVPLLVAKMLLTLPLDFLALWILDKLRKFRRDRPQKGCCLNINVQFWLMTFAVVFNLMENFTHMFFVVLKISPQARRILRFIASIGLIPVPFFLAIIATTILATRFYRITSGLATRTRKVNSRFIMTVSMIGIMLTGTLLFTFISTTQSDYFYFVLACLWLTTFSSSIFFVVSVRETISRLKTSTELNNRSSTWAKVLTSCVKQFAGINLTGSVVLALTVYVVSLPREVLDLNLSNVTNWGNVTYSIVIRTVVFSIALFVHKMEKMATITESNSDETTDRRSVVGDDPAAAKTPSVVELREKDYAASEGGVMGIRGPAGSLASTPTPSEAIAEQVVTVV